MLLLLRLLFIGLCCLSLGIFYSAETQLKQFLKNHSTIADDRALNSYKAVVRKYMYLTLAQIGVMVGLLSLCVVWFVNKDFSGIFIAPVFGMVIGFGSRELPKLEEKIRSLSVADRELERQYQTINKTWGKKALPDF
jgi:hypothetical protein